MLLSTSDNPISGGIVTHVKPYFVSHFSLLCNLEIKILQTFYLSIITKTLSGPTLDFSPGLHIKLVQWYHLEQ